MRLILFIPILIVLWITFNILVWMFHSFSKINCYHNAVLNEWLLKFTMLSITSFFPVNQYSQKVAINQEVWRLMYIYVSISVVVKNLLDNVIL